MSTMKQALFGLIGLAFVALPASSALAGDKGNGEKLATEKGCVGCHAADGNSTQPTNPILAGQYEDYLTPTPERHHVWVCGWFNGQRY